MTGLPWVRMDSSWYENDKFAALLEDRKIAAVVAYWAGLAWSGGNGKGGFVPRLSLYTIRATAKIAADLVDVGLWVPVEGGWMIHDYDEYQLTSDEIEKRRQRARAAAEVRWSRERGQDALPGTG